MHIGFICFGFENIAVEYLSAYLKQQGHQTSLIFDPLLFKTYVLQIKPLEKYFDSKKMVIHKSLSGEFDLIAFSVSTDNYFYACTIAKEIKENKPDLPIVFGGIHAASIPELVIKEPFIDYVCVGEGEEALLDLANAIENQKDTTSIANIWAKRDGTIIKNDVRPLIDNLDVLPFPDKELFYAELPFYKKGVYRINIGRGCQFSCSFCHNSLLKDIYHAVGYKKKKRSVQNVITELKSAKEKYKYKHVLIIDDWFTDDVDWLREFAVLYKNEIQVPFACDVYPAKCNAEVVSLLQEAGCAVASLGIQTVSEKLRKEVLNRNDKNEDIIKTLQLFQKTKIFVYTDFIIGIPGQDQDELINIAYFVNKWRVDFTFYLWLRYYPNTPITKAAIENEWITKEQFNHINEGKNVGSYFDKPITYSKETAKLVSFLTAIPLFSQKMVERMLRAKIYRFFPASSFFSFRLMSIFIPLIKRLFEGKNGTFYFKTINNFKFHVCYTYRIIKENLKN